MVGARAGRLRGRNFSREVSRGKNFNWEGSGGRSFSWEDSGGRNFLGGLRW